MQDGQEFVHLFLFPNFPHFCKNQHCHCMNLFRHIFSISFFMCIACSAIAQQLEIPITNNTLES